MQEIVLFDGNWSRALLPRSHEADKLSCRARNRNWSQLGSKHILQVIEGAGILAWKSGRHLSCPRDLPEDIYLKYSDLLSQSNESAREIRIKHSLKNKEGREEATTAKFYI